METGVDTHLLPRHQEDGALFGMHHLPENVVQDEEFTPTVLEKLHLVVNLRRDQQMCKNAQILFNLQPEVVIWVNYNFFK